MGRKNRNKKKDPPKSKAAAAAASPTSRSSPESGESQESEASAWKDRGNSLYGSQQYDQAVTAYRAGLQILQEQAGDSQESDSLSIPLRGNLAMTLLKLEKFEEANEECTYVLDRYPDQTKGTSLDTNTAGCVFSKCCSDPSCVSFCDCPHHPIQHCTVGRWLEKG